MRIILRFVFFASQILYICGKVILLRESLNESSSTFICLSEDDGGALVWNTNIILKENYLINDHKNRFYNVDAFNNNRINCKMNKDTDCLQSWSRLNWNFTNSVETPMGPVFDQRWEEFKEYSNFGFSFDQVNLKKQIPSAGALSFSTRAPSDVHILFCNTKEYEKSACFWVLIDAWDNTNSVIRKCIRGVRNISPKMSPTDRDCRAPQDSHEHTPLSETEWRTFVITWNFTEKSRNISAYNTDHRILTYKETTRYTNFKFLNFTFFFIKTRSSMLFRVHEYDFLHTSIESAILTSPVYLFSNSTICIQVLIGLCTECDADVVMTLYSFNHKEIIDSVTARSSPNVTIPNLPTWHLVKLNRTFSTSDHRNVTIQVIPKLRAPSRNPLWAIADVRQCSKKESLRRGNITLRNEKMWISLSCQKLFYNEHTVVKSEQQINENVILDKRNFPKGKIGPQCLLSSERDRNTVDCSGNSICYKEDSTSWPRFVSKYYSLCFNQTTLYYDYECITECGVCKTYSDCNTVTGACTERRADNSEDIYIPPMCRTGVNKHFKAPSIVFTSKMSIQTELQFAWKEEYGSLTNNKKYFRSTPSVNLFSNMTLMTGDFENLKYESLYWVMCTIPVAEKEVRSEWKSIKIYFDYEKFIITPAENSITFDMQENSKLSHLYSLNYYLKLLDIFNNRMRNEAMTKFPYTISGLSSYTLYSVNIYIGTFTYLSLEACTVRTLEGVPTQVDEVRYFLRSQHLNFSNTFKVTLLWKPPRQPNGEITYKVRLKVKEYHGCRGIKFSMSDLPIIKRRTKKTNITVLGLNWYTSYIAQVTAHNSRHSSNSTDVLFSTKETDIPTETFDQLEVHNWILSWQLPKDCTTISGPLMAKIKITGVSYYVRNYIVSIHTDFMYYDLRTINPPLTGVEKYKATVYVIRPKIWLENVSAYQELYFETPPTAPPVVTNLEVAEIDDRVPSNMTLYLKWQSPRPPLHGQLHYYNVTFCYTDRNECSSKRIESSNSCDLWDEYICEQFPISQTSNLNIQVFAYNKHVTVSSPPSDVPQIMFNHTKPDVPGNVTFKINDHSVIDLQWRHPHRTGRHLRCFTITIHEKTSNLKKKHNVRMTDTRDTRECSVEKYTRYYRKSLHLFPSTRYNISLQTVTIKGEKSVFHSLELNTPSDATFNGDLQVMEQTSTSTITLYIPPIVNDTRDSIMHIIVKGPDRCKEYSKVPEDLQKEANVKMYEIAWHAAVISTDQIARRHYTFILGDNQFYGNVKNCPLHPKQHYEVLVIVKKQSSAFWNSSKSLMLTKTIIIDDRCSSTISAVPVRHEAWLLPVMLLLSAIAAGYYIYQTRNRHSEEQIVNDEIIVTENNEYYEIDAKSVISKHSKQNLTTFLDTQSLSRATTSEEESLSLTVESNRQKTSVKLNEFEDYVREAIQSGLLDRQYEAFPCGQTRPSNYGKLPQNAAKNRYGNLVAYDETRVILNKLPDDDYSDYINANYITGYKGQKYYIAAQGPQPNTVVDFWRMIWQENVLIICMVTNVTENGKTLCEQYWPNIGQKKQYGDVVVMNAKHDVFVDYCFRTFHVTCGEETRKIEHLHYMAWPDYGVPIYTHSVAQYLKKLLATSPGSGPVVVHSSAGVGRTGTIILCDICLHQVHVEKMIDVFAAMTSIRNERANMVDTKQQYLLAHLALVECLLSVPSSLPCDKSLPARIKELKTHLPVLQQRLQNTAWQDEALRPVAVLSSLSERNRAKHRFPELISNKVRRISLERYPTSDKDSDYLPVVCVDGIKLHNQYLAAQLPMPSTIMDFWRMVAELKVELVLMLQPPDPEDPTCCAIVPADAKFKPMPYLNITKKKTVEFESYTSQHLFLTDNSKRPPRKQSVTILCLTEWKPGRNQPPPPVETMISFWQAAERISRSDKPTVTLCHDGVTGTGLYLALSFLLERMTVERECDVCVAVRAVRRSRPDFVLSLEHLEYLCDAVTTYVEYFKTYANFS